MSGFYGIDTSREVIRVHVKKCDGLMQPETKKFSVDPQITSFEMLQNILAKAFDIKSDFTISYHSQDGPNEVYLSMLSDWDMDAAFQNASDPSLRLKVDLKPFDEALEDWDIIAPVEIPQYRMTFLDKNRFLGNITGTISNHVERTVSHVQRVMGIKSEDEQQYRPIKAPMTDMEFRNYLDSDGHMVKPEEFRLSIYQGGVEPSLRRVVWRHLLNIYPEDMSGRERFDYMKKKENEYFKLRDKWKEMFNTRMVSDEAKHVASLVKKDVLRTDRTHKFYSGGDESKNLISLYHLLVTYALTHPEVSYCQGMSDIASPLLVVQKEEAQAYLCFCGLMKRLKYNFLYSGEAITTKLQHLSTLMEVCDPVFEIYLKEHGAEDLFFCYRWLLLEMKREFPFDDALYMLEVMWSTLPPAPPDGGLELTDSEYSLALLNLSVSPHSPSVALKQTQYAHLLAKRRTASIPTNKDIPVAKSPKVIVSSKVKEALVQEDLQVEKKDSTPDENENEIAKDECDGSNISDKLVNDSSESSPSVVSDNHNNESSESYHSVTSDKHVNESSECSRSITSDKYGYDYSDCSRSVTTSCSITSSLSTSQSVERFPSLISASVEEKENKFEDETDVVSSSQSKTLTQSGSMLHDHYGDSKAGNKSEDKQKVDQCHLDGLMDEDESQSQFHLSLEETDTKKMNKKSKVPQIKGSFFSGMKKILSSPKRRAPGRSQQMNATPKTSGRDSECNSTNGNSNVKVKGKNDSSISDDSCENENTLFDMTLTMTSEHKERSDSDSGNGSFTSSTNSSHLHMSKSQTQGTSTYNHNNNLKNKKRSNSACNGVDSVKMKQMMEYEEKYKEAIFKIPQARQTASELSDDKNPVFCENHFDIHQDESVRTDESKEVGAKDDGTSDCMEVIDTGELESSRLKTLPSPDEFGYGNPFLMFLCLTVLVQHRDYIMKAEMEYDELAMYFDKMVRKHNVHKVLHQTRNLYTEYIKMQQKKMVDSTDDVDFSV